MWELFEQRLEAEHYLQPAVAATAWLRALLDSPPDDGEAAFRAALGPLSRASLQALYGRLFDLTGGPDAPPAGDNGTGDNGTGDNRALDNGTGEWQPYRDRLVTWRLITAAAIEQAGPEAGQLTEQDLPSVAACAPIDERIDDTLRAVFAGRASDGDVAALAAAVRDYRQVAETASVSAGGRHLIGFKIARVLDSLGRACELLERDAAGEVHFSDAVDAYADIGEAALAAASAERRAAAARRRVLDADGRLSQLMAGLDTAPAPSADRAAALAGLAELAHEHGDIAEARAWLARAVTELKDAGCGVPAPRRADRAVASWIRAIPPAGAGDRARFLRRIAALLTLHCRVAVLRMALTPAATGAAANLERLIEIIAELPGRAQAVQERLEAQLSEAPVPSSAWPGPARPEPAPQGSGPQGSGPQGSGTRGGTGPGPGTTPGD